MLVPLATVCDLLLWRSPVLHPVLQVDGWRTPDNPIKGVAVSSDGNVRIHVRLDPDCWLGVCDIERDLAR
jgi:hypothetical protein